MKAKASTARSRRHALPGVLLLPASLISPEKIALMLLPWLIAACTSAPVEGRQTRETRRLPTDAEVEQYNALVPPQDRIICREEVSVRSNIPQRKCRLVRDIEETSRLHREQLRNVFH